MQGQMQLDCVAFQRGGRRSPLPAVMPLAYALAVVDDEFLLRPFN